MAIATGQITITDFNDALTLTGFIGSNHPKTQQFNPDNGSYNPNWASTNLVLTPSLYKQGTTSDIIASAQVQSISWYDAIAPSTKLIANADYALGANGILTVKTNKLAGLPAKEWICEIVYRDPASGLDLVFKTSITFSRVINGGGIADAVVHAPNGNVFKNDSVSSLIATAQLWRGSVIDTTLVTYQWYKQDPSVSTDQGGGIGWRKLDSANTGGGTSGHTSATLTIPAAAVDSFAVFKCIVKDTDTGSNTYNQSFQDTVSFVDLSDPIQITITSTGGDIFKNGSGSTTLTAKTFQAGQEVDSAGTKYTYTWKKYNSSGTLDATFNKTGKSITVGDADVDVKATFLVEVD